MHGTPPRFQGLALAFAALALLLTAASGCQISIPEGRLPCTLDTQCPGGWVCRDDGRCHTLPALAPHIDAGSGEPSAPDASTAQGQAADPDADAGATAGESQTVPRLGARCSESLSKACNGNQSLDKLVCLEGSWHWNGTCDGDSRCDLRPGPSHGTCQPLWPACKGHLPGAPFCDGAMRLRCSDDLLSAAPDPCPGNTHCAGGAAVSCECDAGFELAAAGGCKKDSCPTGYVRSERGCDDVDECAASSSACGAHRMCENSAGSFRCGACHSGYMDVAGMCLDVDECAASNGGCGAHRACNNNPGSFACGACQSGYADSAGSCVDVNECNANNGGCGLHRTCYNSDGTFTCGGCDAGYEFDAKGTSCVDIDECARGVANCPGACVNTDGSYRCLIVVNPCLAAPAGDPSLITPIPCVAQ